MISAGIEPATFSVLTKCDNRYTRKPTSLGISTLLSVIVFKRRGVRTVVDVLNAIQTVFQVKSDYVTLATTQAQNVLALSLLAATAPRDAVVLTRQYLFGAP